jgi:penicillin-insensitive murein endopeptidase
VGVFADDGSSISVGTHAHGALLRGVVLPEAGAGYTVPPAWRLRGRQYATDEVVRWLTAAFATVAQELPGGIASVGDLSALGGGGSPEHKSHGSGRDIDVFFYAVDSDGRPLHPERAMLRFSPEGRAFAWSLPAITAPPRACLPVSAPARTGEGLPLRLLQPIPRARFDARRTWALVRAMLSNPAVEVQWIFIHRALGELMLRQGPSATDDSALVARAAALMHQPSDAQTHDDHMHIRVYCDPRDRSFGCLDRGPLRWWKKRWKDLARQPPQTAPAPATISAAMATAPPASALR